MPGRSECSRLAALVIVNRQSLGSEAAGSVVLKRPDQHRPVDWSAGQGLGRRRVSWTRHSITSLDALAERTNVQSAPCVGMSPPWEQEQKGPALKEALVPSPSSGKAKASFCRRFQEFCGRARLFLSPEPHLGPEPSGWMIGMTRTCRKMNKEKPSDYPLKRPCPCRAGAGIFLDTERFF